MGIDKEAFKQSKNIESATKYAKDVLGIKYVNYDDISLEVANIFNAKIFNYFNEFPELKSKINFIGSMENYNKQYKKVIYKYLYNEEYNGIKNIFGEEEADKVKDKLIQGIKKKTKIQYENSKIDLNKYKDSYAASIINNKYNELTGFVLNPRYNDLDILNKCLENDVLNKYHPIECDTFEAAIDHEFGHKLDDLLNIRKNSIIKNIYNDYTKNELTEGLSKYS